MTNEIFSDTKVSFAIKDKPGVKKAGFGILQHVAAYAMTAEFEMANRVCSSNSLR